MLAWRLSKDSVIWFSMCSRAQSLGLGCFVVFFSKLKSTRELSEDFRRKTIRAEEAERQTEGGFHCWSSRPHHIRTQPEQSKSPFSSLFMFIPSDSRGAVGEVWRGASLEPCRKWTGINCRWNLGRTYHLVEKENRPPSWHSDIARGRLELRLWTDAEEPILRGGRGTCWARSGRCGTRVGVGVH